MARKRIVKLEKRLPVTWEEAMEWFLPWKQAQGIADITLSEYKLHISLLFRRFPDAYHPHTIKTAVQRHMGQEGIKPATYNIRLTYLKQFFAWCVKEGIFQENPLDELKHRKAESRIVNIDPSILTKLIKLPDTKTYSGLRDYTLILLSLDCGIRPKEALRLQINDVNTRALEVYIRSDIAKTRIHRTLPISKTTADTIRRLVQYRHDSWPDKLPVFCSSEGTPMTRHTWGDRLEKYSRILGVKITPYSLRHCFALQYLRGGGNALSLQRIMGHSDLSMTKRYVSLTNSDLREQHTLASPLNVLIPKKKRVRNLT